MDADTGRPRTGFVGPPDADLVDHLGDRLDDRRGGQHAGFRCGDPMSPTTARSAAASTSGGISWKPETPTEFCTVTA